MSELGLPDQPLAPRSRAGRLPERRSTRTVRVVLTVLVGLGLWQLASVTVLGRGTAIPEPARVVQALWDNRSVWPRHITATLGAAIKGLGIGTIVAVLLAAVAVIVPVTERALLRVAVATYSLPILAIGPILLVSLSGDAPRVALATLAVTFTTLVAVIAGLRAIPPYAVDTARAFGGTPRQFFWKVRVRCALPGFFTGLEIAFPAAVIASVVGEFLGAEKGLGVYMVAQADGLATAGVWATAVVVTAVTTAGFVTIRAAGGRATRWVPPTPAPARPLAGGLRRRLVATAATLPIATLALVGAWTGYLHFMRVSPFVGKGPSAVWHFLTSPSTGADRDKVFSALGRTVVDTSAGLVIGWASALLLAIAFALSPTLERALMPAALALRTVPIIAILPLLTLLFGRGLLGTVVIVSLIVFFPSLILVLAGLRNIPADLMAVARAYDASQIAVLRKIRLPMALPAVFASLRIGCPGAVLGALLAEWMASGTGLGYLMLSSTTQSAYDQLWTATVVITLLAIAAYVVVDAAERAALARFGQG